MKAAVADNMNSTTQLSTSHIKGDDCSGSRLKLLVGSTTVT